jgi:hypothetical protein
MRDGLRRSSNAELKFGVRGRAGGPGLISPVDTIRQRERLVQVHLFGPVVDGGAVHESGTDGEHQN